MRIIFIGACGHGKVCSDIASLMLEQTGIKRYDDILFWTTIKNLRNVQDILSLVLKMILKDT